MVDQLWVMIEGRGDLLSGRWSCHYLMNNEPLPAIHTHVRAHTHTHTNYFTFSHHPSISSSWLSFHMIRWHLLFRPVQNDRSICVSLRQLHTLSKSSYLSFEIQFVTRWTDIIILFRTTKKQSKSWQTSP